MLASLFYQILKVLLRRAVLVAAASLRFLHSSPFTVLSRDPLLVGGLAAVAAFIVIESHDFALRLRGHVADCAVQNFVF